MDVFVCLDELINFVFIKDNLEKVLNIKNNPILLTDDLPILIFLFGCIINKKDVFVCVENQTNTINHHSHNKCNLIQSVSYS